MEFRRLVICGPNKFANQLLASHMQQFTKIPIKYFSRHEHSESADLASDTLIICDCDKTEPADHCRRISQIFSINGNAPTLVFINVDNSVDLCNELIHYNVSGVLYSDDDIEQVMKAVETILSGDYWLSRKLLMESLKSVRRSTVPELSARVTILTVREQEILGLISVGQSNQDISDKLFISLSTVKTHISNIYKKINTTNRVQAILWAADNLYSKQDELYPPPPS